MDATDLLPLALGLTALTGQAQPGTFPTNDAAYAMNVCTDTTFILNLGPGDVNDLDPTNRGCLLAGETNGNWFFVRMATAGTVAFTLQATPIADLDFAVWGPFAEPPMTIETTPTRCSFGALNGPTGLDASSADLSEGPGGDSWVRYLDVTANEVYLMYVNRYGGNGSTVSLIWDLGAGASFDCLAPPVAAFTASAGMIAPGGSVSFSDQSQTFAYAWSWSFPGGTPPTSTERDPENVVYTALGCHDVSLTVYNAAGTDSLTSTCQVTVEVNTAVGISGEDRFRIQLLEGSISVRHGDGSPITAELFDLQGKVQRVAQTSGDLRMTGLRPGPVLLRITATDGVLIRKVVVP